MNNKALRNLSYGMYLLSSMDGNRPTGCIINTAFQITSTPATIAISVNHDNYTNKCIKETNAFALSVLSEDCDSQIIARFGFSSGKDNNKFDGFNYKVIENLPIIEDCISFLCCNVISFMETATHTVFLGEVNQGDVLDNKTPMTYSYYHKVKKGTSPKNAPTYTENEINVGKYKCSVCGYVYDGEIPFDQLPDTYVCPICGASKSKFVLI